MIERRSGRKCKTAVSCAENDEIIKNDGCDDLNAAIGGQRLHWTLPVG